MFKKGQLCVNRQSGTYVEVIAWPLVRLVKSGQLLRDCAGLEFHASKNFTLIGNNYKAKATGYGY